jgi:hypothetical protein
MGNPLVKLGDPLALRKTGPVRTARPQPLHGWMLGRHLREGNCHLQEGDWQQEAMLKFGDQGCRII